MLRFFGYCMLFVIGYETARHWDEWTRENE